MDIPHSSVLWLDSTLELPNINVKHSPIEAEHGLYVAGVFSGYDIHWGSIHYCTLKEGSDVVEFFDLGGGKKRTRRYHLLVLRFDENLLANAGTSEQKNDAFIWLPAPP